MGAAVTGVTVVTTNDADGRPLGRTVSAMCSVSAEPPLLLVSIHSDSPLEQARSPAEVRLPSTSSPTARPRSPRPSPAAVAAAYVFAERDWWPLVSGAAPLLHGAAARFRCDLAGTHVAGTHTLVLGAVTRAERGAATPLAYTRRGYVAALSTERLAA